MDKIDFKKLLFKVAFCTMACDGEIHPDEIEEIKKMDKNSSFFEAIDLSDELSQMIKDLKKKGTKVIIELFSLLKSTELNPIQELLILEIALRIIVVDNRQDENEIKFVNLLRSTLNIHDETIIDRFGEVDILHTNEYSKNIQAENSEKGLIESIKLPKIDDLLQVDFNDN